MLTYLSLDTSYARLGNHLFQIANIYALSLRSGLPYGFISWKYREYFITKIPLLNLENYSTQINITEPDFYSYRNLSLPKIKENTLLNIIGYYQYSLYFDDYREEIRELFSFSFTSVVDNYLTLKSGNRKVIGLHIRRGDYTTSGGRYPPLPKEYYLSAMKEIKTINPFYIICTDDPKWCALNFPNIFITDLRIEHTPSELVDLCLLSRCDSLIIANSTFSWWGAYLSDSSEILSPPISKSFHFDKPVPKEWYPNNWITIDF